MKNADGTYDTSLQNKDLYRWIKENVGRESVTTPQSYSTASEKEKEEVDFEKIYGKTPTQAGVVKTLKQRRPEEYKNANTYDEAMAILKERRPHTHKYITEHLSPPHPLEHASDAVIDRELAERGYTPDGKQIKTETPKAKPTESRPVESMSTNNRWTAEDEANARRAPKKEVPEEAKKEEVKKEESPKKELKDTLKDIKPEKQKEAKTSRGSLNIISNAKKLAKTI